MIPVIETERLRMREWRQDDLDAFAAMSADPEVARYIGSGKTTDRDDSWRAMAMFIGHWKLRGYGFWVLEDRATGAFVGRAGLWCPEGWPGAEVGWALAREHWGKGYATEAGRAALEWGFDALGLERIVCLIHPDNARSLRVAQRLELRDEGTMRLRQWDVRMFAASPDSA